MSAPQQAVVPQARLILLETLCGTDGEARIAILPPGPRAVPIAFTSMEEALAALRNLGSRP
ncbi:hypothetical protein JMJ56_16905 [Belnapia sp. T18]|uniref:Uncharacterized protein n=1 Tax=Belnapia arida TaxID=2804533 RepID=A0ABS1U4U2_9PROT|nr:hypothetical protein [Belnapia arida]MBL6079700.1 hypothetical protein [Belnapia arida]